MAYTPILTPAYGRDYKTQAEAISDLLAGKDFILNDISSPWDGKLCSIRDFKGQRIEIRHNELRDKFSFYKT